MRRSALLASSGSSAIVQSASLPALQPPASPVGVAGTSSDAPGGHAAASQASTALVTLQPGGPVAAPRPQAVRAAGNASGAVAENPEMEALRKMQQQILKRGEQAWRVEQDLRCASALARRVPPSLLTPRVPSAPSARACASSRSGSRTRSRR